LDSSSPGDIIPLAGQVLTVIFNQDIAAWDIVVSLILITFFMALSALVSSSETAFFSISYTQQRNMEKDGDSIDKAVVEFLDKPRTLLGTILIGNNIFNLTIVALSYRLLNSVLSEDFITQNEIISFVIQIVIVTFFIVMFGEVVPKVYATRNNIGVARSAIRPLQLLHFIFKPLIRLLVASSSALEKKLEGHTKGVSAKDIDDAIDIATENSEEEFSRDTKILKGIVKFGNITATQIMKSRMDVVGVDISTNFAELLGIVRESGYSRIPVFEGDFDKVIGIIYAKDLLPYLDETAEFKWHSLIKPALYVPESKKIDALLEEFQQKRVHMAIVVDEYGGSSGLVTLEDVLEEVIGEIKDEFDDVMEIDFQKIDDHNYIFEGKTAINDVCKVLEIPSDNFDEVRGESDSLAGLLLELKGEMPQKDDLVETDGFSFRVVEMNATRIVKVQVTIDEKK
jgi:gliding motility-associated protein GldE